MLYVQIKNTDPSMENKPHEDHVRYYHDLIIDANVLM